MVCSTSRYGSPGETIDHDYECIPLIPQLSPSFSRHGKQVRFPEATDCTVGWRGPVGFAPLGDLDKSTNSQFFSSYGILIVASAERVNHRRMSLEGEAFRNARN